MTNSEKEQLQAGKTALQVTKLLAHALCTFDTVFANYL